MAEFIQKTDTLNEGREKLNAAIQDAEDAKITAEDADRKATQALAKSESTQTQLDTIVIEGDSSVEAAQARVDEKGVAHATLKARIDNGFEKITAKIEGRGVSVEEFGAKGDYTTDDASAIQNAINYVASNGGGTVLLMPQHLINTTVNIPSNVTVRSAMRTKIKSTSLTGFSPVFLVEKEAKNVTIENLTFDFESNNSCTAIHVEENVSNILIDKIEFNNFYALSNTQQNIVRLKTGIVGTISNLSFRNIKIVGNGTIGDSNGSGRCIRTDSFNVTDLKDYSLNIDKVHFEDCFNVDANGNFIVEDFDLIHFQHNGVGGVINVSNISAKNFSKRLMKIQAPGVNISNVTAESDRLVTILIGAMSDNINIQNVNAKGNIEKIIEFNDCNNVNVSSVRSDSYFRSSAELSSLFVFTNATNITINNVVAEGNSGFVFYGEVTENIYVSNVILKVHHRMVHIQNRNVSLTDYDNGKIRNIHFNNLTIHLPSTTYNGNVFSVVKSSSIGENHIVENISFKGCKFSVNPIYSFGVFNIYNVEKMLMDNIEVDILSSDDTLQVINFSNGTTAHVIRLVVRGVRGLDFSVRSGSDVLFTRSKLEKGLIGEVESRLELEKTPVDMTYVYPATEDQVTIS